MALIRCGAGASVSDYKTTIVLASSNWAYGAVSKAIADNYSKINYRVINGTLTSAKYGSVDMENTTPGTSGGNYDATLTAQISTTPEAISGVSQDLSFGVYSSGGNAVVELILSN